MTHDPEHEVDEELTFHLEQLTRDYIAEYERDNAGRVVSAV